MHPFYQFCIGKICKLVSSERVNFAAKITKDFMGFISVNIGTVKTVLLTALDYISVQNTHCHENRFALTDGIQTSLCLAPLLIQFNRQEFGIK